MATSKLINILTTFITLFSFSFQVLSDQPSYQNIPVPSSGAHSFAFDSYCRGPYTSVSDGRVLLYQKSCNRFIDFAFTSPNRTREVCDGVTTLDKLETCGRPFSLVFLYRTHELFIADASLGLFVVGRKGGQATLLASGIGGVRFRFTVGLDVDQQSGDVYFTDASTTGGIDEVVKLLANNDTTGRLLKYDGRTKTVSVLQSGISGAAGVAISKDCSFLLLTEFIGARILKYWLRGPKANTAEVIMNVTGNPDNIRRRAAGDFWVAVTSVKGELLGIRINGVGTILETLCFSPLFEAKTITEVYQHKDSIYLGSLSGAYLGVSKTRLVL